MSIRTFRNGVLRYKFGLDGMRTLRSQERLNLAMRRHAMRAALRREFERLDATARAKAAENRKPSSSAKPSAFSGVLRSAGRLLNKAFGRKQG